MTKAYRGYGAPKRDAINDLDCTECGGWFPSFTALADHVTKIHVPKCSWCGKNHHGGPEHCPPTITHGPSTSTPRKAARQVTDDHERATNAQHERERDSMTQLPRSTRPQSTARRAPANSGRIPGSTREESNDYNPFLKASHIGRLGDTAKLVLTGNVRVSDGVYGEQIVAEVRLGKVTYDWGIKLNTPNHRELEDTLGLNTAKWKNKIVAVEVKENMGRDYVAIQRARQQSAAKKTTAKKKKTARR